MCSIWGVCFGGHIYRWCKKRHCWWKMLTSYFQNYLSYFWHAYIIEHHLQLYNLEFHVYLNVLSARSSPWYNVVIIMSFRSRAAPEPPSFWQIPFYPARPRGVVNLFPNQPCCPFLPRQSPLLFWDENLYAVISQSGAPKHKKNGLLYLKLFIQERIKLLFLSF